MSVEEIKALVRRWYEAWSKGKAATMAVIDESYATDFVLHPGIGEDMRGLKDFKRSCSELFSAFPDYHMTFDDLIVEGDKVASRWTMTGTHQGEFMGIPPTNKKWKGWAIAIRRIIDGKFVEE